MLAHTTSGRIAELESAAAERLRELDAELDVFEARRSELEVQIDRLRAERTQLRALLETYGAPPAEPAHPRIALVQDKTPADHVVDLLQSAGQPMHFREIEKELRSRGVSTGGGKDPANALLATYFNDPRLYRPARGTYAIRPEGKSVRSVGTRRRRRN